MMKRSTAALAATALAATRGGCAAMGPMTGWTSLVDGTRGMENFNRVGDANWMATDGAIQATSGGSSPGYLVTRNAYRDFRLRAEFWASDDANSGIFLRCQNPVQITDESCYEANIFDQRPDPTYATGAIVKFAPVAQPFARAGGKWNTFELTARGDHLVVVFNGVKTVDIRDSKFASGPIALQWGRGTIKWRKVEIRPL
ncbi:3-keto-disaccharide hydrolase [Ramlibacter sp.]|uniref:3-keto-disaccharide hydrolase n=1 Tax=Ramlibacter sp. TaxID=1917967 RepID=UPI002FC59476